MRSNYNDNINPKTNLCSVSFLSLILACRLVRPKKGRNRNPHTTSHKPTEVNYEGKSDSHSAGRFSLRNSLGMLLISLSPGTMISFSPGKADLTPATCCLPLVTVHLLGSSCCPEMAVRLLLLDNLAGLNAAHGCDFGLHSVRPEQDASECADTLRAGERAAAAICPLNNPRSCSPCF